MNKYLIIVLLFMIVGCSNKTSNENLDKYKVSMSACEYMIHKANLGTMELIYENIYRHGYEGPQLGPENAVYYDCDNLTYISYEDGKVKESYNLYKKVLYNDGCIVNFENGSINEICNEDFDYYLNERTLIIDNFIYDLAVLNDDNKWFYEAMMNESIEEKNRIITTYENVLCEKEKE